MVDLKAFGKEVEEDEDIKKMIDDFNALRKRAIRKLLICCGIAAVAIIVVCIV
jgi:hypothetical protein